MEHLEDILQKAAIEEPLLHNGRWYVTKDAALAGMTAVLERCANVADAVDSGRGNEKEIARFIRARQPLPMPNTGMDSISD